ncbi:MAG: FAD-dependent oxidoreductase [Gammaproteobacteria bacterium]|nr:FAD-dependent oxidoreductase [Gammaproteobacteria bacterium]MDD9871809.1 FAD-dependent oxidoreductase [Gammaproteobacteria bacterium]
MKSHAQVAVIGGGVVGCSVLFHLTRRGWKDVVLIERAELTSGSTWHAAGGMHTLNSDPNVARLQDYTIHLYKEIEKISGQSCGIHITGGYLLADTEQRLDFLKTSRAKARHLGLQSELVSIAEAVRALPIIDPKHFIGALFDPFEGHVDPSGVTNAYAKAARIGGAEIYRHNRVTGLRYRDGDGEWEVQTEKGTLRAEIVINAGGLWAREVGRMVGLELPLLAMQHQYIVTDELPLLRGRTGELPHCIDFGGEMYLRQEGHGVVLGTYEQNCVPWSPRTTPWDFGHELLPEDVDRIAPSLEVAFQHFPTLADAGIKKVINGPFVFAPDGNPLVGPVRGRPNFWVACGVMAGFSQGGGIGLALSNWIVDGDPGMDVFAMDVARFGDYAGPAYTRAKVRENYQRRFRISFPNEELPAARPLRTTPVYEKLRARGAVFGAAYGLEHALWFAPPGVEAVEQATFRRSNAFTPVAAECKAVRGAVGLLEISNFAKYEVAGAGAAKWLAKILAGRIPQPGRMALAPMLNGNGKIIGDFTVAALTEDQFLIFGSGIAEDYHMRWFESHLENGVAVQPLRTRACGFAIAGPRARELFSRVTDGEDLSAAGFPFLSLRKMEVAMCPALVGRISFTGEHGYEIWTAPDYQPQLFDALCEAGDGLGLRLFGARALNSLRLEKSFGGWTREYTPDYSPLEAGLGRFVDWQRKNFTGRGKIMRERDQGPARKLAAFHVAPAKGEAADPFADEPIFSNGKVIGALTSGGYAHHLDRAIALGYLPANAAADGATVEVEILGEIRPATVHTRPQYDPDGKKMRS